MKQHRFKCKPIESMQILRGHFNIGVEANFCYATVLPIGYERKY